jgi:hypothetical protein
MLTKGMQYLADINKSEEFKEKSKAIIEKTGKCEWCGNTTKLVVHHYTSLKRSIRLWTLSLWVSTGHESNSVRHTKEEKEIFKAFCDEHHGEILESAKKSYLAFNDVIVLCNRCHYAIHKGLKKCPTCDGYTKQNRNQCSKCAPSPYSRYLDSIENMEDEEDDDFEDQDDIE